MFAWLITLGQWIWNGIQAATTATVAFLSATVQILWSVVRATGSLLWKVGSHVWTFFRATWDHVLKPAWDKVFKFVDRVHDWAEKYLGPTLRKLNDLRKRLNGFWKTYVRPILDIIDVTRRVLQLATTLHIPFAHAIDVALGNIEATIERRYQQLLGALNDIINLVNRVITLDGLVQRVALIRSLERDYVFAWRALTNSFVALRDVGAEHTEATQKRSDLAHTVTADTRQYMRDGTGPRAAALDEMALIWRNYLRAP